MPGQKRNTTQVSCWVYGDDPDSVFDVTVAKSATVSTLKDAIRVEISEFPRVAAKDLPLYSVPEKRFKPTMSLDGGARLDSQIKVKNLRNHVIIIGSRSVTLNYWVHGDLTCLADSIVCFAEDTIGSLRDAVHVDNRGLADHSRHLLLYKFPLANDEHTLENMLCSLKPSNLEMFSRDSQLLSEAFAPFDPNSMLHFVVIALTREVPIQCWIRGEKKKRFLEVKLAIGESISQLRRAIVANYTGFLNACPDRLNLFKIRAYEKPDLVKVINDAELGNHLNGNTKLQTIFSDIPLFEPLCVAVQVPPEIADNAIAVARQNFLHFAGSILCGRPDYIKDSIPPTLLHPVFGRFVDGCKTIVPTAQDNLFAEALEGAMSESYDSEMEHVRKVKRVFEEYGVPISSSDVSPPYPLHEGMSVNGHHYVIFASKSEATNLQALGYYVELTRELATKFYGSALPCILLIIFGPYIEFSAAAWNLRPMVQLLTDPIAFKSHSDTDMQLSIMRRLAAFREAAKQLKEYYQKLQETPQHTFPHFSPHLFPHPTSYALGNTRKEFKYVQHLVDEKPIFLGTEGGDRICIKFVRSYSRDAHEFLASQQCAPVLRGFEKVAGGWFMVVMDMLDEYETLSSRSEPLPSSVFSDMHSKVVLLHGAQYVHGDIRDANIMVSRHDAKKFMIIDFDWAGRVGEVRYPAGVNFAIKRPAGACDGELIEQVHDEFMMQQLQLEK